MTSPSASERLHTLIAGCKGSVDDGLVAALLAEVRAEARAEVRRGLAERLTAADRFDVTSWDGPAGSSDEYLAGLRFAGALVADPGFDF